MKSEDLESRLKEKMSIESWENWLFFMSQIYINLFSKNAYVLVRTHSRPKAKYYGTYLKVVPKLKQCRYCKTFIL